MHDFNILTRRAFLDRSFKIGLGVALSTLTDIPFVVKRALAEGNIGLNGKKLLFIFLRGANDGLNSLIPIADPSYVDLTAGPTYGTSANRPSLVIPPDPATNYLLPTGNCYFPQSSSTSSDPNFNTFWYAKAINAGNGFAALHPSLKFLAPVFNLGDLAMIHRVAYPKQSRSHFDSQSYWENGNPNNNLSKDGIFYRTILQSGLASTAPLTAVSIQSALPLILRGSEAAMTNLSNPNRYNLLGIPNTTPGNTKADGAIITANDYPFPGKQNREFLSLQYENMTSTLSIFANTIVPDLARTFTDDGNTDGDSVAYNLFPTRNAENGGYAAHGNNTNKYVVDTGAYNTNGTGFFNNLKAAALVLNKTDAVIAGTEMTGFDTHNNQGTLTGSHPNLQRRIAWAMYALRKFFLKYGKNGSAHEAGAKCSWDDLVVVTLSEFGRTTIENGSLGTDHAEAGAMFVAGGGVAGGIYGCSQTDNYNGQSVGWVPGAGGSMFGVSGRYLQRAIDYRSVLGRLIRNHLGATQNQLNQIIPGYANGNEMLLSGGTSGMDGTKIAGEVPII
jgi:uncharacterized protein (DUF1501 family)